MLAGISTKDWSSASGFAIVTENSIYLVDEHLVCVAVRCLATGCAWAKHPAHGMRVTGAIQHTADEAHAKEGLPLAGWRATLEQVGKAPRKLHQRPTFSTSTVQMVLPVQLPDAGAGPVSGLALRIARTPL